MIYYISFGIILYSIYLKYIKKYTIEINQKFTIKPDRPNRLYISSFDIRKQKNDLYRYIIYTNNPIELKERIENDNNLIYICKEIKIQNYIYKIKQLKYSDSNYFCNITYRNNNNKLIEELISDYYSSNNQITRKYPEFISDKFDELLIREIRNKFLEKNNCEIIKIKLCGQDIKNIEKNYFNNSEIKE